jgi:hypothetical protein
MALRTRRTEAADGLAARDDVMSERVSTTTHDGTNSAARAVAAIAAAVPIVWSIVALIRLEWADGFDAAPVEVAGLAFTPIVAIATLLIGIIALAAAASSDRASKLAIGALLACVGLAILLAGSSRADLDLEAGHGWLALIVGAVLLLAGMVLRRGYGMRREVRGQHAAY